MILIHWLVFVNLQNRPPILDEINQLIFPHLFAAQQSVVASAIYHWQWRNNTDEVIFFHPWRALFCLWWGLTGYRPTGSETRNDGRSSSENNARLKDESACDTSARFAFPSITGNKMSFPSFPLQNFRGALSLSLSLSLRSRACACSLIVRSLFFLCTISKASVVEFAPCFASILGSHTVNSCRRESFCSSFCLLFTFALLCLFFCSKRIPRS